jgi:hypothetical protein
MRKFFIFQMLVFCFINVQSLDCESSVTIILKNMNGGFYQGQTVKLTSKSGGEVLEMISDEKGEVTFTLPCNTIYNLTISNYTETVEIKSPEHARSRSVRTLSYPPDMIAKEKVFAMNLVEQGLVDQTASELPDTFFVINSIMPTPKNQEHFSATSITLKDIDGKPLTDEMLCLTGVKRGKSIKGKTDKQGKIVVWLAKGDHYTLNFKYNKNYSTFESRYSKGSSNVQLTYSYLGTKEIERRKKIEADRIAAEEKRLKDEEMKFLANCKKLGITPEEGRKREVEAYKKNLSGFTDTVILAVLNRNKWDDKLIVCDLTGSMSPYSAQLSLWYQLHYQLEKNLQFVFFNDGDNIPDEKKKIEQTGGIYYTKANGIPALADFMANVSAKGDGGDCAENNMEALIKGTQMAAPFKELVMIVDNNAPVKDIELLKKFNIPVHIILCGVNDWVMPDYLNIAWKTKGSIHTIEQDIKKISLMGEGQDIVINGITYRLMGGEFVRITKI